jgi:tetratricopeptide (TPR) repeat protein
VLARLCDLAIEAGDHAGARRTVSQLRTVEGKDGSLSRYAEVEILIDLARRGDARALHQVPRLISEIALIRGDWWGVSVLKAQVAEAQDRLEDAIDHYLDAIKRGKVPPATARRALDLLNRMQRYNEIDGVVANLSSRGMELEDLKLARAFTALRRREFDRAVAIARETIPEMSNNPFDHITLGQILREAGKSDEAGREFRRALELGPKIPAAWLAQVEYLVGRKDTEQAQALTELARTTLSRDVADLTLARCYALVGNPSAAERHLKQALAAHPSEPALLRWAAGFYILQKQRAQAEQLLAKLLDSATAASDDDRAWARRSLGVLKVQSGSTGSIDEAMKRVEENLKNNPKSIADQRAHTVLLAMQPARRNEAIRILESREQSGSLDPEQRFYLALLYLAQNEHQKSERQLIKLLDQDGTVRSPDHLSLMVRVQLNQGRFHEAERWLAELKRQELSSNRLFELEASLLKAQKRDGELQNLIHAYARDHAGEPDLLPRLLDRFGFSGAAEQSYRKAVAENPKEPERMARLIAFLTHHNRASEAFELWTKRREDLTPDLAASLGVAVAVLPSVAEPQRGEIESWLVALIKAHSQNRTPRLKLAYLCMKQGHSQEAEALYRSVLAEAPGETEALNNLASLLAFHDGPREEALSLINRALDGSDHYPPLLDTRALVYLQMNQPERAITDLQRILASSPNYPIVHFHLARAHEQMGNSAEARNEFEQAERLGLKPADVDFVERNEYLRLRRRLIADR